MTFVGTDDLSLQFASSVHTRFDVHSIQVDSRMTCIVTGR